MSEPRTLPSPPSRAWALAWSVALPVLALVLLGQDDNWDLRNYHLYNPHAWLQGRMALDVAPAQLQTWHNPLLDVPLYLMNRAGWHGAVIGLWLTLPLMASLYALLRLHARLAGTAATRLGAASLALLGCTGAAAYGTLGTSFNEAFVAIGILASLSLVLAAPDRPDWRPWLLAGAIAGSTAGLKLTAAIYCLGLAATALAAPTLRRAPARLAALLAGGVLGFAFTYGAWGLALQQQFGNPVFPYFNQVFRSPAAMPEAHADTRFRADSPAEAALAPWYLLADSRRYSESTLSDPRPAAGVVALVLLFWQVRARRAGLASPGAGPLRMLAGFLLVSSLAWVLAYGIYRYVLPMELLCCLLAVLWLESVAGRWRRWLLPTLVIAVMASTNHPSWGRLPFSRPMLASVWPALPAGSLVVVSSLEPLAYAVVDAPATVPVLAVHNNFLSTRQCTALQRQALARISAHPGPLWLLRGGSDSDDKGSALLQRAYGLRPAGACLPLPTSRAMLQLCPLGSPGAPLPCPADPG